MKRIIETYGKNGVLEIIGNPQESVLYLKDRPIQYSWYAEVGSTWRYHIAQGLYNQAVNINKGIEDLVKRGIENEGEFLWITEYFNAFFKYGKYEYGYYELFEDVSWLEIPKDENYKSFDYYGGSVGISPTQNLIDDTRVEEYKEQILKGSRPVIILLHIENSWMFYILDGHHKFCAYGKAKIKAHAVIITKLGNEYMPIEETAELAKRMNCTKKEYINRMRKEKENLSYYKKKELNLEKTFKLIETDN
jgi:hypothetical protein